MSAQPFLANGLTILDTNNHTYRTDPKTMFLVTMGETKPPLRAYAVWVVNSLNQTIIVQVIANIVNDQSQPDVYVGNGATIPAGSAAIPYVQSFDAGPFEYLGISASVEGTVPPTSGTVTSKLLLYYGKG
jgi:hypothetical protein